MRPWHTRCSPPARCSTHHCARPVAVGLLHSSCGRSRLPGSLLVHDKAKQDLDVRQGRARSLAQAASSSSTHTAHPRCQVRDTPDWTTAPVACVTRLTLVASCFLGAFPPVLLRAVCFVRAIFFLLLWQKDGVLFLACVYGGRDKIWVLGGSHKGCLASPDTAGPRRVPCPCARYALASLIAFCLLDLSICTSSWGSTPSPVSPNPSPTAEHSVAASVPTPGVAAQRCQLPVCVPVVVWKGLLQYPHIRAIAAAAAGDA